MNSTSILLLTLLMLIIGSVFYLFSPKELNLGKQIVDAKDYMINSIDENGQFTYRVHLNPEYKLKRKYNVLRHMGAIYALNTYYALKKDETVLKDIAKTVTFIKKVTFDLLKNDETKMGIWSRQSLHNGSEKQDMIKLGAQGLGLIALCPLVEILPDIISKEELIKVGQFILGMQREDGNYYSKYYKNGQIEKDWISLYYPGEVIFGLVELYKLTLDKRFIDSALKGIRFLAKSREHMDIKDIPADHWALIASDKLLNLKEMISEEDKNIIINHAKLITNKILSESITFHSNSKIMGGFNVDGRTTPTATRLEGLLAMYSHFESDFKQLMKPVIDKGILFLLKAQMRNGPYKGAFTRGLILGENSKEDARAQEIRIDYVQHALSAMLEYERLFGAIK